MDGRYASGACAASFAKNEDGEECVVFNGRKVAELLSERVNGPDFFVLYSSRAAAANVALSLNVP